MGWNARICSSCGSRFEPNRLEARLCRGCERLAGDLPVVVEYLNSHPEASLTRLALATGVSEETIRVLARAGRLPRIPAGADVDDTCECTPNRPGTCPACRARIASQLVSAVDQAQRRLGTPAAPNAASPVRGMRTRSSRS